MTFDAERKAFAEEWGMKSEALNCLGEAAIKCASLNVPRAVGPVVVDVFAPYYCRATDAFAGEYCCESRAFATHEEAEAWIAGKCDEHDELSYRVTPLRVVPAPLSPIDDEEIPF